MFRFRVRKIPGPLLKFTQKAVLFQDISIFFVLKTELYLSSGTYFFFWKLVFHFKLLKIVNVHSINTLTNYGEGGIIKNIYTKEA